MSAHLGDLRDMSSFWAILQLMHLSVRCARPLQRFYFLIEEKLCAWEPGMMVWCAMVMSAALQRLSCWFVFQIWDVLVCIMPETYSSKEAKLLGEDQRPDRIFVIGYDDVSCFNSYSLVTFCRLRYAMHLKPITAPKKRSFAKRTKSQMQCLLWDMVMYYSQAMGKG